MPIIRTKRTKFTATLFISLILGLTACSSKKSALGLIQKQKDGRWFCTPQGSEEWLCQESDSEFKELGKEQRKQSSLKATESSAEATAEKATESSELSSVETIETTKRVVAEVASAERTETESSEIEKATEVNAINSPQDTSRNESAELEKKNAIGTGGNEISVSEPIESEISPWVIQLAAYQHQSSADSLSGKIEGSQLFNTRVKGRNYISVVVTGFESRWQAQQRAEEIKQEYPKLAPWVRQGADFKKYIILR
jgi:uncharacterized Zn finger protein (UPF0148 family)